MTDGKQKVFTPEEAALISESVKQSLGAVKTELKTTNHLMTAIVVVLFIAVITMLLMVAGLVLEGWRYKTNSYEGMTEIMRVQQREVGELQKECEETKKLLKEIVDWQRKK